MSDTTARDQLAQIISHTENLTDEEGSWALPEDVADEIIRAGWRPTARVRRLGQRMTDPDVEATYITLTMVSRYGRTVEFNGQTLLDLDPDGHLIGVELLGPVEPKEGE